MCDWIYPTVVRQYLNWSNMHADAKWLELGAMKTKPLGIASDWHVQHAQSSEGKHRVSVDDCIHEVVCTEERREFSAVAHNRLLYK